MSPLEALQVLGLKPGKRYPAEKISKVAQQAVAVALIPFRFRTSPQQQEEARKKLAEVKEAKKTLECCASGGVVYVKKQAVAPAVSPPPAAAATPARPCHRAVHSLAMRKTASSARGSLSKVLSVPGSVTRHQITKKLVSATGNTLYVLWFFLTWPVRLFVQRRLWAGATSTVLTAALIWLCYSFVTGGVLGITSRLRSASENFNQVLVRSLKGRRSGSRHNPQSQETVFCVNGNTSMVVYLDGTAVIGSSSSVRKNVRRGTHKIEMHDEKGEIYSTKVDFPAGGTVTVECHDGYSRSAVILTVEVTK